MEYVKHAGRIILAQVAVMALAAMVVVALLLAAFAVQTAKAASSATTPSVKIMIVEGPGNFEWGDVLLYRIRLTNSTKYQKTLKLGYLVSDGEKSRQGGLYHRTVQLGPKASRLVDFRVSSSYLPLTGSHEKRCLQVYSGDKLADWTCADSIGK